MRKLSSKYSRTKIADCNVGLLKLSNGHFLFIDLTRCQYVMYIPCTQSQGYTPGLGSGKSHPDKSYEIRFTKKLHLCGCATVQRLGNISLIINNYGNAVIKKSKNKEKERV